MTVAELVARARQRLVAGGVPPDEAPGDAEVLARHVLGWDLTQYTIHRNDPAADAFAARYDALLDRRARREPVSQIVGQQEFWGLDFEVTRDVLTPRPETELIVEEAVALFGDAPPPASIVDVGTGSGCLAVALAREFGGASVIATDVSEPALAVARRNALKHGVATRIEFRCTDLLDGVDGAPQLIVANPPYVSTDDAAALPAEVRDYEPAVALFAGVDGLACYRRLLPAARRRMPRRGHLVVEIGAGQHEAVAALADEHGFHLEHTRRDLQGIVRTLVFAAG